jgi:transcriptional regulator with PAS, ATPase and Fis domain
MLIVFEWVRTAAKSDISVLILGPTGSGKEVVARMIHELSRRAQAKIQAVNCAALPDTLFESEIFGYEKGAFTGAHDRKPGRLELANEGTLFLDEIADMSLIAQAKLLRVLEEREIERLGGAGAIKIDVRFLASTHRDLPQLIKDGRFREDLYYRLNVFPIAIPPLRARSEDVLPLVQAFAADLLGAGVPLRIDAAAERVLRAYRWPGNVRELRNFVERLSLLRPEGDFVIDAASVTPLAGAAPAAAAEAPDVAGLGTKSYREIVEDLERSVLEAALAQEDGNIAAAARLLKSDRGNLYRRMRSLGLVSGETEQD